MCRTCRDERCTVLTLRSLLPHREISKKMMNSVCYYSDKVHIVYSQDVAGVMGAKEGV